MKTVTSSIKKPLLDHIISECQIFDCEKAYREGLDSEGTVTVAGMEFWPSCIIEEMDPTAFRCGVNDYCDGLDLYEIRGESYESDAVNEAREEFADEIEAGEHDPAFAICPDNEEFGCSERRNEIADFVRLYEF